MDFEAYNLFAQVTIQDDKIIKIDNVYGDGGSSNDSYINKAVNGTSSKTGVVKQITEKGNLEWYTIQYPERPVHPRQLSMHVSRH